MTMLPAAECDSDHGALDAQLRRRRAIAGDCISNNRDA